MSILFAIYPCKIYNKISYPPVSNIRPSQKTHSLRLQNEMRRVQKTDCAENRTARCPGRDIMTSLSIRTTDCRGLR